MTRLEVRRRRGRHAKRARRPPRRGSLTRSRALPAAAAARRSARPASGSTRRRRPLPHGSTTREPSGGIGRRSWRAGGARHRLRRIAQRHELCARHAEIALARVDVQHADTLDRRREVEVDGPRARAADAVAVRAVGVEVRARTRLEIPGDFRPLDRRIRQRRQLLRCADRRGEVAEVAQRRDLVRAAARRRVIEAPVELRRLQTEAPARGLRVAVEALAAAGIIPGLSGDLLRLAARQERRVGLVVPLVGVAGPPAVS